MNGTPPVHPQAGSAFRRRSREGLGYVSAQRVTGLKWAAVLVVGVAILLGVVLATLHYRRDADFRHLIDAVLCEIPSKVINAGHLRLVGQRGTGVGRLALEATACIELLEGDAPRVDLRVTLLAARLIPVLLQTLPSLLTLIAVAGVTRRPRPPAAVGIPYIRS